MADEKAKADEAAPGDGQPAPKKKKLPKAVLLLGAILLLEGVTVAVTFSMAGGPSAAHADRHGATAAADESNKDMEELVLEDKFPNSRRGDVYLYDTQIFAVVRKKHHDKVKEQVKGMTAQIRSDVATVFRRADPSFMHEDELQTLTRQIKAVLDERFGRDAEGQPIIQRVVITKCTEFRIEF